MLSERLDPGASFVLNSTFQCAFFKDIGETKKGSLKYNGGGLGPVGPYTPGVKICVQPQREVNPPLRNTFKEHFSKKVFVETA